MHEPVLVSEVLDYLHIVKNGRYIDATVGAGGHTKQILECGGEVLGIDQDNDMLEVARETLEQLACPNFKLVKANFSQIASVAKENGFYPVDGILFDLGVSSLHYSWKNRGFSFESPQAPLDMRLDQSLGVTAADLLNSLRVDQLEQLFTQILPRNAKKLSRQIVQYRQTNKFETVADFLKVCSFLRTKSSKNPATVSFMALRIAVNSELESVSVALPQAVGLLKPGGRIAVITFHSVEDSLVKKIFRELKKQNEIQIVTKTSIRPSLDEIRSNPRSRSARLRVVERV